VGSFSTPVSLAAGGSGERFYFPWRSKWFGTLEE
jgi:hypothetical protein